MFGNTCLGELAFEPAAAAISMSGLFVVFLFFPFSQTMLTSLPDVQLRRLRRRLFRHALAQVSRLPSQLDCYSRQR
jgi:hypothetical protein